MVNWLPLVFGNIPQFFYWVYDLYDRFPFGLQGTPLQAGSIG